MRSKISQDFDFLRLRKRHGLTQADLGELLKVSKNYICQIETGRKVPSETLMALAERIDSELEAEKENSHPGDPDSPASVRRKLAHDYLDQVWAAAGDDKELQGYVVTKLRLMFPLDKPPFLREERES